MYFGLHLTCAPVLTQEEKLELALHKICPYCGADNDLKNAMFAYPDYQAIPLCFQCGKQLWDRVLRFGKWAKKRKEEMKHADKES